MVLLPTLGLHTSLASSLLTLTLHLQVLAEPNTISHPPFPRAPDCLLSWEEMVVKLSHWDLKLFQPGAHPQAHR